MEDTQRTVSEGQEDRNTGATSELADIDNELKELDQKSETGKTNLIPLTEIEAAEVNWLFPGYVPRNSIFSIVGDGGVGKTSLWCSLVASLTTGERPFFLSEEDIPYWDYEPETVLIFSAEDSVQYVLKKRLQDAEADESKIHVMDPSTPGFNECKFGTPIIESFYEQYKPGLVVFDPIQGFLPPNLNMGQRNAMRDCLSSLVGLGEKFGVTTCIIVHTNKQVGLWGRRRMADSADFWDICRSVLIAGETQEDGIRYLSHEKCNYGQKQETILFSLEKGTVHYRGTSELKDKDYVQQERFNVQQAPAREEAEEFILRTLDEAETGEMEVSDLDEVAIATGISKSALKRAKTQLKKDGKIKIFSIGYGKTKKFYVAINAKETVIGSQVVE